MPTQDTSEIKNKIIFALRKRGPSLPVHIAGETGLSILFASAFLSELLSEKKIKISSMKVGSSPLYFIPGQEYSLERFSQHLKSKEKEALFLLKQKRFLKDEEQAPAIRVALREIRDFAIPFKKNNEIFWRYFVIPETGLAMKEKQKPIIKSVQSELDIFNKDKPKKEIKKKRIKKKITGKKQDDKFFNRVKEFLSGRSIEISDIKDFSKNDIILIIKVGEKEQLLVAYNKKRINEEDIIKAHKKALELNLPYIILSPGEPLKKLTNLIEAIKELGGIEKIGG